MKEDKRVIKSNEFRIGNLVCWMDEEEVFPIMITGVVGDEDIWVEMTMKDGSKDGTDCGIESVRGIPLDEEWLIKSGCKKTNTSWTFNESGKTYYEFSVQGFYAGDNGIYICNSDEGWYLYIHVSRNDEGTNDVAITDCFHSLHEFQNKIYALTSEELTIKTQ